MASATQSNMTVHDLNDRLDSLWISYLHHLDQYTKAQATLQKYMSAGFISLARANFNTRNGVRQYGQDFYHDRAVASRRVDIASGADGRLEVELVQRDGRDLPIDDGGETDEDLTQQPSPPLTPPPESEFSDVTLGDKKAAEASPNAEQDTEPVEPVKPVKVPLQSDPIRWFGILVPRELRSAQASFTSGADEAVAEGVNAAKRMREVEIEIRRMRKEIRRAEKRGAEG